MGKKSHGKSNGKGKMSTEDLQRPTENIGMTKPKLLSRQKRNDLNQYVDRLLKVSSSIQTSPNASKDWEIHLEIDKLLDKINQIELELQSNITNNANCFEEFAKWMTENEAEFSGVKIAHFPGYDYGLQAEKDFNEGDLIVAVPRKLMMAADHVARSILGALASKDPMLQHMPYVALSLLLLVEKFSQKSFWQPYISVLPKTYTTVLYFKTNELLELKGSLTFESALKQCKNIARQYAYLYKLFQSSSDEASELLKNVFTYQQYRYVLSQHVWQNFHTLCEPKKSLVPNWLVVKI